MPLSTRFRFANLAASRSAKQIASDYEALHFACALVNCEYSGIAVVAFNVTFARVSEAAVNLYSFVGDAICHLAGIELGARGIGAKARCAEATRGFAAQFLFPHTSGLEGEHSSR